MPTITTVGESLYWCYANLAMAHAAVTAQSSAYTKTHFIIRSRLFKGLNSKTMNPGSIADDERLKMILPQACHYCGAKSRLDRAENMVWACQSCNSAKGDTDLLDWYAARSMFPPLRRYLKMAIEISLQANLMDIKIADAPQLPFSLNAIPHVFPKPDQLVLWIVPL